MRTPTVGQPHARLDRWAQHRFRRHPAGPHRDRGSVREMHSIHGLMETMRALEHEYANRLHIVDGLLERGKLTRPRATSRDYPARPGRSAKAARKDCAAGAGSP